MAWSEAPIGDRAPEIVNAVVEIPKGSRTKYEYDEALGIIRLDGVLFSSVYIRLHMDSFRRRDPSTATTLDIMDRAAP